jgi:hypothetical protein
MNAYLRHRVNDLLHRYTSATLATCGPAGPQISIVFYSVQELRLHLALPHGSDHLFNLEMQPLLVLMTAAWRLHGQGRMTSDTYRQPATVVVTATRLHILGDDGQHTVETIDF